MAATKIIKIKSKNGTVYVYEDTPYWNKEKKHSTHKRVCIGKLGDDGNIIYNNNYSTRKELQKLKNDTSKHNLEVSGTTLVGQGMILDKFISELKLDKILKEVFGTDMAERIIALSRYIICRGKALSSSPTWLSDRGYDGLQLTSQRISELLCKITPDKINTFFKLWMDTHGKNKALLFDITSVSTYGRDMAFAEWGYNRDREHLEQINISLLTTRQTNIPLWFDILPGSMADVAVLTNTIQTLSKLGIMSFPLVQDRGFYSKENLKMLTDNGVKFMIPIPSGVKESKDLIKAHRNSMIHPKNVIELEDGHIIYGKTTYKTTEYGRTWYHIFYDPMRKEQATANLMVKLQRCMDELKDNKPLKGHTDLYARYFNVKDTPKRGRKVEYNHEAIQEYLNSEACYWVLQTTFEKDVRNAYRTYKDRNDDELHFDDFKNVMDLNRLRCHSDAAVRGKIFIHFIALAILSRLRKTVKSIEPKTRNYWSESDMLSKVETYTKVHFNGKYKDVYSMPTKAQRQIFSLLEIPYYNNGVLIKPNKKDMPSEDNMLGQEEIATLESEKS